MSPFNIIGSSYGYQRRLELDEHEENNKKRVKRSLIDFLFFYLSVAYTQSEAIYRWNKERQIVIAPGMKMSQFDLVSTPVSNYTLNFKHGMLGTLAAKNLVLFLHYGKLCKPSGNHSMISVHFNLHRHMGSFLIQVYGPCILLVVLSWVSFWLNREATADRVSLGTSLQLVFLYKVELLIESDLAF